MGEQSTPTSATLTESLKARKRKRSKVDNVIDGVAQQLLQAVEKSDQRMIELEEKRMKLEERQMERELQAKREERDFQMKLMQMMMSSSPYIPPHVHMASQSTRPAHSHLVSRSHQLRLTCTTLSRFPMMTDEN